LPLTKNRTPRARRNNSALREWKGSSRFAVCSLRFTLPPSHWLHDATKDASVDILGYALHEGTLLMDMTVHAHNLDAWIEDLRDADGIISVRKLGSSQKSNSLFVACSAPDIVDTLAGLHLTLRTPFTVTGGAGTVVVAGPGDAIGSAIKMSQDVKVQIERVFNGEENGQPLLTARQSEIFQKAMAAGYFEVPRRVSLTELASRIGVAPSSLSEMLAVVEKRILSKSLEARPQPDASTDNT
jgi:predicted DNA binding protein